MRPYGVTLEDYETLAATVPSIEKTIPIRELTKGRFAHGTRNCYGRLVGCTGDFPAFARMDVARGRFLSALDVESKTKVCVLAPLVARELFGYEDPVGRSIHIGVDFYDVVGVMRPRGEIVTPNWSIFLKSLATSKNLDFGPKYPIEEIASKSIGSRML